VTIIGIMGLGIMICFRLKVETLIIPFRLIPLFLCFNLVQSPMFIKPHGIYVLYQITKWLCHFVILKPLHGLVFNSQKCCHTFVNWYYGAVIT
jgi:hypothetical protein